MPSDAMAQRRDIDAQHAAAVKNYEAAIRYIQKQHYDKAKEILEKLIASGPAEIADRARVHLRLCEQKLQPAANNLKTAEDYYVAGVSELNARRLERAIEYLTKAAKAEPNREETHYALAAAHALHGNADAALEHLKTSIDLRPQNRFQARQDEDFQSLASDPRFANLVSPKQGMSARAGS
jgi:tetratricopeptide (TPR) repeat protein